MAVSVGVGTREESEAVGVMVLGGASLDRRVLALIHQGIHARGRGLRELRLRSWTVLVLEPPAVLSIRLAFPILVSVALAAISGHENGSLAPLCCSGGG